MSKPVDFRQARAPKKKSRFILVPFLVIFCLILLAGLGFVGYVVLDSRPSNSYIDDGQLRLVSQGSIVKGKQLIETEYFAFEVEGNWELAEEASQAGFNYKYLSRDEYGLAIGNLNIRINDDKPDKTVYVMPVEIDQEQNLIPKEQTTHCSQYLENPANDRDPRTAIVEDVEVLCWTDNSQAIIVAGEIDGDTAIELTRPNGQQATYSLTFHDTNFAQKQGVFEEILKTFQVR